MNGPSGRQPPALLLASGCRVKPPRPQVNRRELLRLRKRGAGKVDRPRAPGSGWDRPGDGLDLIKASRPAMGSYFEVRLGARTPGAVELATRALDLIDGLERQLTVYNDESEVSRLNAAAHLGPIAVEPGLFSLLERAVALGEATHGAYDVTSGAL